ncbi:PREDICTED: slit homolog 1 protein-like [Branchiostoma belcheri]|uniref:Slit homolog 1 protein-like n=1 Tax=Branchiostoma belcheri TaxID=7741 RepID=A0A6P4Y039_BRABE|nr:PREDICTED: slit homolog 1 protein-like [Branchiostoma belcheri]
MTGKLKRFWFLLVIILNEIASTTPCSTFNCLLSTTCRCNSKDLTTVPQKLPRRITELYLNTNDIATIHPSSFSRYRRLIKLNLSQNRITSVPAGTFSGLPDLKELHLSSNKITTIQRGAFTNLLQLQKLYLNTNNINTIQSEPTILSFRRVDNDTSVQEETLHLVCEVSGMPKPDITVTLPSGPNTNAMSGGRVTVEVKNTTATVTITGVTAADAGQYICIATNPSGSASATLSFISTWLYTRSFRTPSVF